MNIDISEYTAVCTKHTGEAPPVRWLELAQLLDPRHDRGWHFVIDDCGRPYWIFGLGGAALVVADVDGATRRFHLFECHGDADHYFDEVDELAGLLHELEYANRGLTSLQVALVEDGFGSARMLNDLQIELARQDAAMDISHLE